MEGICDGQLASGAVRDDAMVQEAVSMAMTDLVQPRWMQWQLVSERWSLLASLCCGTSVG